MSESYINSIMFTVRFIAFSIITATITDVMSSNPGPLNYQIVEELPIGTQIGSGLVVDAGMSSLYNSEQLTGLRFSLVRNPTSDVASRHINVLPLSGLLEIKSPIDRDQLCPTAEVCSIKFDVVVVCPANCFSVITIIVEVLDINDQTPTFIDQSSPSPVTSVTLTLPESSPPGSQFALPAAYDADSPEFSIQRYELFPVEARSTFALLRRRGSALTSSASSSSLQLVLSSPLDREITNEYHLTVVSYDGGLPSRSASCAVLIVISDVNDNDPIFERSLYTVDVYENATGGTLLTTLRASDEDLSENGHVTYHLLSNDDVTDAMFAVNETSGELTLRTGGLLDREIASTYRLSIEARDHGVPVRSSLATVTLNVLDVNDNAPQVAVSTLSEDGRGHVIENTPTGTFVGLIAASDPDIGDNALTSCYLEHSRDGNLVPFELVALSGTTHYKLVTGMSLDREATPEYHLTIVCADHGIPSLSTRRDVIVYVGDVNDNAPYFQPQSDFRFVVSENCSLGHVTGQLIAYDADAGENALVGYKIIATDLKNLPFEIDPRTGVITTKSQLDYEVERNFRFLVEATDAGQPQLSSVANVTVDIADVNDVTPKFSESSYTFSVLENQFVDDVIVGRVEAVDLEEGEHGDVRYSIVDVRTIVESTPTPELLNNSSDGLFVVHPVTGIITVTRPLDRERTSSYRFTIIASDTGLPRLTGSCDVIVRVTDVNDNSPSINSVSFSSFDGFNSTGNETNVFYVSSASRRGRIVTQVSASDSDEGQNAALTYYISGGGESFAIKSSTGLIYVASPDLSSLDGQQVSLVVLVVDGGSPPHSASVNLTVFVNSSVDLFPVDLAMYADDDGDDPNTSGSAAAASSFGRSGLLANPNFLIVIAVAIATVAVALALIAAILFVAFRSRRNRYEQTASGNQSTSGDSRSRRRESRGSSPDGGGAFDESLSVFESLTGNDKLVPDDCGRNGRLSDALFGSGRCFESFGKADSMNNDCTVATPRCPSEVIVINAMAIPEGDRDSASSDSGRGPSEDEFNAACVHTILSERPITNGNGNLEKFGGTTRHLIDPFYGGSLRRRPDEKQTNDSTSSLFRSSALPRCTSHELALAVNCRPNSSFQMQTLPPSSSTVSSSNLRGSTTQQGGGLLNGNSNSRHDVNSRSLRRVTFSNPESTPPTRKSSTDINYRIVEVTGVPHTTGYGSSSDAASLTSLTSGSYDVGNGAKDDDDEVDWRQKPVSYIFV